MNAVHTALGNATAPDVRKHLIQRGCILPRINLIERQRPALPERSGQAPRPCANFSLIHAGNDIQGAIERGPGRSRPRPDSDLSF